jgi:hypothetical protein
MFRIAAAVGLPAELGQPFSCLVGTGGVFTWGYRNVGLNLMAPLHLVPGFGIGGTTVPLPNSSSWLGV